MINRIEHVLRSPVIIMGFRARHSRRPRSFIYVDKGPLVVDDPGHTDDAALFGAAQRILERCRAYELEHFVKPAGTDFADLFGDGASM